MPAQGTFEPTFMKARPLNRWQQRILLSCMFCCVFLPDCPGQSVPSKTSEPGASPEVHGIAVFGCRSHHVDLMLRLIACLAPDDTTTLSSKSRKVLESEFNLQPKQFEKLSEKELADAFLAPKANAGEDAIKAMDRMEEQSLALLAKCLDPRQMTRFEEIACQFAGPMALRLDHYSSRFKLSTDQITKIGSLADSYFEKAAPLMKAMFTSGPPAAQAKLNSLACELDGKIFDVLTEKQRSQWKVRLGKRFDWKAIED
jgi:hypothetical protein